MHRNLLKESREVSNSLHSVFPQINISHNHSTLSALGNWLDTVKPVLDLIWTLHSDMNSLLGVGVNMQECINPLC